MDFGGYSGSSNQLPIQVNGGIMHTSSSEFSIQDDTHLDSSFGHLPRTPRVMTNNPSLASSNDYNILDSSLNILSYPVAMTNPRATSSGSVPQQLHQNQFAVPSPMELYDSAQGKTNARLDSSSKDDDLQLRHMIQQILSSEKSKQSQSHDLKIVGPAKQHQTHCQQPMRAPQKQLRRVPETQVSPMPTMSVGACANRLLQYIHQQRNRPRQNGMAYWRKFVAEFFDPNAKKRWCLSKYEQVEGHAHFAFSRGSVSSWNCDLCGTKSGKGFEAHFDILPRWCKLNFEHGVIDEYLSIDYPCESKLPSGCIMLHYDKVSRQTVYKNSRVIHEGQLRVTFTKELKISCWEFCAIRHEEFVLHRSIAPQVKQLVQASQKSQDNHDRNISEGNLRQSLQATHNRFVKTEQQLTKTMEVHVNELGLTKPLSRFLQVNEVIDSMKDLITFGHENKLSPIESLKRFAESLKSNPNQMNGQAHQRVAQGFFPAANELMQMQAGPLPLQNVGIGSVNLNGEAEAEKAWNSLNLQTAQPSSSNGSRYTGNELIQMVPFPIENLRNGSVVTNRGVAEAEKAWNSLNLQTAQPSSSNGSRCSGNELIQMVPFPIENLRNGSVVTNRGVAEAEEAWNSLSLQTAQPSSSNGSRYTGNELIQMVPFPIENLRNGSVVTNRGVAEAEKAWNNFNSYQNLQTTQPSSSNGSWSAISQAQGNEDPNKYVMNKLMMQNMLNNGVQQEPQMQMSSQAVQVGGGIHGRNVGQRGPRGPRKPRSSTQANTGNPALYFRGSETIDVDALEDVNMPTVMIKEENFFE